MSEADFVKPRTLQRRLLKWFDANQRDLPWRKNKTPYRIWVSEIMLQQTQVKTVIGYYERFMRVFPDVASLAHADIEEVLKLWEGLGYYRRARQLHAAAKVVVDEHRGVFPTQFEDVLALPGIGRYTAGAILSISQDQKLPILEGNTLRLYSRLMTLRQPPRSSQGQKQLWAFAERILPGNRCGDFNQALMELGAQVCTPRSPNCDACPIRELCATRIQGLTDQIPVASKKLKYVSLHEAVVVIKRRGKFLLRLCGDDERWAGLWDFPRFDITDETNSSVVSKLQLKAQESTGLDVVIAKTDFRLQHAVTKYRIQLDCYVAESVRGRIRKATRQH